MYYFGQANEQIRVKDEKIAELEKEIGRVHRNERTLEIETFEKKTSLLESQIYNLTKLIENGVYEVADIKETIKKDSLRQKALENTLEMSNKVITNLGNKIANMEENITLLKSESKQQIYKLVGQVASLNGQIDKFVGEVSSLNIQLSSLRPLLDTVVHLKNDISKSNQVFEELKDIVQTDSDIQRKVKIEVEALSSQMSKLEARFDESADLLKDHPNGCADVKNYSGVLKIKPNALTPFLVSCESKVAGSGWTVIQRRIDGSVNFYRNWADYKQGFGNIDGEYFIGLERLHKLTKQKRHELYIKLVDQSNEVRYARYDNFVVEDEDQKYQLSAVGSYTGNAGDSFKGHRGLKFSTFDRDHDTYGGNCALDVKSAWWFFNCGDR